MFGNGRGFRDPAERKSHLFCLVAFSTVWGADPRPLPRTPIVSFEDEAAEDIVDGFQVVAKFFSQSSSILVLKIVSIGRRRIHAVVRPLVRAWTMADSEIVDGGDEAGES